MKNKSKKYANSYCNMNDQDLSFFINTNIERYLKLKKSSEIAKKLLKENCHDFYISLSTVQEDVDYVHFLDLAKLRNIDILHNYDNVVCTVSDVASVLDAMCILELSWLDEHRYIFNVENSSEGTFEEEEDRTLRFYRSLISGLSDEQISSVTESYTEYVLSLC